MPPINGKPLILYISPIEKSLGVLLAQNDQKNKDRVIYYIRYTLVSYAMNYTFIKKAFLIVVFASQKLRHYMPCHNMRLISKIDPLKYLLNKATLMCRLEKWVTILS